MSDVQYCDRPMIKALICLSIMSEFNFCKCHRDANHWKDCSRRKSKNSINHSDLLITGAWLVPSGETRTSSSPSGRSYWEPNGAIASAAGSCWTHDITVWELLHFLPSSDYYQGFCRRHSGKLIKTTYSDCFSVTRSKQEFSDLRSQRSEGLWYDRTGRTNKFLLEIRGKCSFPHHNQLWCCLSGIPKSCNGLKTHLFLEKSTFQVSGGQMCCIITAGFPGWHWCLDPIRKYPFF